jgi:hypothetical protein
MTASGVQTLILGLQALGMAYLLYNLVRLFAAGGQWLIGTARHPRRENVYFCGGRPVPQLEAGRFAFLT